MSRTRRQDTAVFFANWIGGHWSTILKFCIPIFLATATVSFSLGVLYSNLSGKLDQIRAERDCNEKINAEIDKNRVLRDEITKKATENLLEASKESKSTTKP
ncbi:MAG TPA: hypothetical protein VKB19_18390 [Pedobacter sp.]|nr:hypothetical protein [Pedobacter sp.]